MVCREPYGAVQVHRGEVPEVLPEAVVEVETALRGRAQATRMPGGRDEPVLIALRHKVMFG